MQQNSIATKFLLQQPIATDFSAIVGNIIFFIAIEVYCNNLKFIATKPPNAILKSVTVTYCNKKFVATNCINNIFCCNKVFLIIIKILLLLKYFKKIVYCNEIFAIDYTEEAMCPFFFFVCCLTGLALQIPLFCWIV